MFVKLILICMSSLFDYSSSEATDVIDYLFIIIVRLLLQEGKKDRVLLEKEKHKQPTQLRLKVETARH